MGGWSDEIRDDSLFCGSRVALRSAKQIVVVRLVPRDLLNLIRLSPRFSGWLRPSARAVAQWKSWSYSLTGVLPGNFPYLQRCPFCGYFAAAPPSILLPELPLVASIVDNSFVPAGFVWDRVCTVEKRAMWNN